MFECTFDKGQYHLVNEMVRWCKDNIGDGGWLARNGDLWSCEGVFGRTTFKFMREDDYTLFLLRWS
jgi:hypothetical protein